MEDTSLDRTVSTTFNIQEAGGLHPVLFGTRFGYSVSYPTSPVGERRSFVRILRTVEVAIDSATNAL